jgi:hypothetical protein
VDAVEAINGAHADVSFDVLAYRYAKKIGKPAIAGTDIHDASEIYYGELFGVYSDKKLNNIADFVSMILNNEVAGLKTDESRLVYHGTENVRIPVEIRNEEDKIMRGKWKEYV